MELRTITKQNNVPFFRIAQTNKTPSEVTLNFEGFEKGSTQYIAITTTKGKKLAEYEFDSVMNSMLNGLQKEKEYIISIDSKTARNELTVDKINELLDWVEN